MGKYDDFIKPKIKEKDYEKVNGTYGCQTCNESLSEAYFDKYNGVMFWVCLQNHRSEIKVGV